MLTDAAQLATRDFTHGAFAAWAAYRTAHTIKPPLSARRISRRTSRSAALPHTTKYHDKDD